MSERKTESLEENIIRSNVILSDRDPHVRRLYDNKQYLELLGTFSFEQIVSPMNVMDRIYLILALLNLGRLAPALINSRLAADFSDTSLKPAMFTVLGLKLKSLGIYTLAIESLKSAVQSYNLLASTFKTDITEEIEKLEYVIQECQNDSNENDINISRWSDIFKDCLAFRPIHKQMEHIGQDDRFFDANSICFRVLKSRYLLSKAYATLKEYEMYSMSQGDFRKNWDTRDMLEKDPLKLLNEAIILLAPDYVYKEIIPDEYLYKDFINYETSLYPELNYDISNPKVFIKDLMKFKKHHYKLLKLCSFTVKHKLVIAFYHYLNGRLASGFRECRWILYFLDILAHKFSNIDFSSQDSLSQAVRMCTSIIAGRCCADLESSDTLQITQHSLTNLINAGTNISTFEEYTHGRLFEYFTVCGYLYKRLAWSHAKVDTFDVKTKPIGLVSGKIPSPGYTNEMIRKFIMAVTAMADDDYRGIFLYQEILEGILLYGAHVGAIWFFNYLLHYFAGAADYNLYFIPEAKNRLHPYKKRMLSGMVQEIVGMEKYVTKDIIYTMWSSDHKTSFLTSQVFQRDDETKDLVLLDRSDTNILYEFEIPSGVKSVRKKVQGESKLRTKLITSKIEISKDWILLWIRSYIDHHSKLPDSVQVLLQSWGMNNLYDRE